MGKKKSPSLKKKEGEPKGDAMVNWFISIDGSF